MKKVKKIKLLYLWDNTKTNDQNWLRIADKFKEYKTLIIIKNNCYFFKKELNKEKEIKEKLNNILSINEINFITLIKLGKTKNYYHKLNIKEMF